MLGCDISSDDQYIITGSGDKKATLYEVVYWEISVAKSDRRWWWEDKFSDEMSDKIKTWISKFWEYYIQWTGLSSVVSILFCLFTVIGWAYVLVTYEVTSIPVTYRVGIVQGTAGASSLYLHIYKLRYCYNCLNLDFSRKVTLNLREKDHCNP